MANKDDYLTDYRQFFEHFKQTLNPNEQLPVKLASYKFINLEVVGGIIDWTSQYLTEKKCPKNLISPLIKIVIDEVRKNCKKDPVACGFNVTENAYEPLKLMQSVILQVNEICLRYLDNSMLCTLPSPGPPNNIVSYHAARNTRRRMEDRHAIVHDLNTIFNNNEASPSSYYAIFDGHAGHDAATYSAAHLHQYLAESKYFATNPEKALIDAFCKTDLLFLEKCKIENFSGGTTAVCALLRPKEKNLYIAWVGDSQAVLAKQGVFQQCVNPHKPERRDERQRIESNGGTVIYWGTYRVNGQLAVSRAIGDSDYKPYITAEPEVREFPLDGTEDFLVIACDGLWDVMQDHDVAALVYNEIYLNPETVGDTIAQRLIQQSKEKGSTDNISVIVVFLREPTKIANDPHWTIRNADETSTMEAGFDNTNASSNPFANSNGTDILSSHQKEGFLLDLDGFRNAGAHNNEFFAPSNGKSAFDDEDDLGPETDVDALDDVQSPMKSVGGMMSDELEEKVTKEIDANLLKSVAENCNTDSNLEHDEDDEHEGVVGEERKGETPTPPADEVHDAGLDSDSDDDEWNYIKGANEVDKENVDPLDQTNPVEPEIERALTGDESEEIDNMSQLNPNAEEFVPVSPTRTMEQPVCAALKEEQILAQSPRRPNLNCDFNVPEEEEFEEGVKKRPSEFYNNGHENGHKQSSQEIMENFLNCKNIDEIEFQPVASPTKVAAAGTEQFIFGPNSAFSTPGKFMDQSRSSTKANYGDESSVLDVSDNITTTDNINPFENEDLLDKLNKEKDPMSMSFYQDKEDGVTATPFDDLNKVHELSDDEEEKFQQEQSSFNDSISNLPEHDPLSNNIVTTDLDIREQNEMGVYELPKSPVMENNIMEEPVPAPIQSPAEDSALAQSPLPTSDLEPVPSPLPTSDLEQTQSPLPISEHDLIQSPLPMDEPAPIVKCLLPTTASEPIPERNLSQPQFETDDEIVEHPQEPLVEVGAKSPLPDVIAEEAENIENEVRTTIEEQNLLDISHPEPVVCYASREAELFHQEAASEEVSAASDIIQEQQFIPDTSHEVVAQTPEPVVIDNTPDHEEPENISKLEETPVESHEQVMMPKSPSPVVENLENKIEDLIMTSPEAQKPVCELSPMPTAGLMPPVEEQEVATPITPVDEITSSVKDDSPIEEVKEIKHDLIEQNVEQPSTTEIKEEPKPEETIPNLLDTTETSLLETTAVAATAAAAAITTVTIGAGVVAAAETKQTASQKTKAAPATRKSSTTKTTTTGKPLASTKTSASKTTAAKSTAAPLSSRSAPATKTATTKSTTGAAPAKTASARPRPATASKTVGDKKPLHGEATASTASKTQGDKKPMNGDVKPAAPRPAPIRRPQVSATTKPAAPKTTTTTTTAKPPTSTTTKAPATKPAVTSALKTTAAKPRPNTLSTTRTTTTTKVLAARPLSSTTSTTKTTTTKTNTTTASAKPKATSAPISKPRVPLTNRTATARAPDAEKQNKENVNKLTASRTAAATKTATARKVDTTKSTVASKTLASKTTAKKPLQKNGNSARAAESKEAKIVPNGVPTEKESLINEADLLVKDLSPVNNLIIDNSQVAEVTAD